ncbi:MAG TPA: VOC family protein [Gemmatimonadales bacterium]|jgi:catechol 2,3-dioxygenase-like lactoylglutathione lyase family enzyme|nr:VOC family protein [Gemmatimonadales bacterium]
MLASKEAMATIAVRDVKAARQFYEGKLGLRPLSTDMPEAPVYQSGSSKVLLYQSQYAGTNKATAATWPVGDDIESEVQALKAKGVTFEHYDLPGMTRKGEVHVGGGTKAAWFKDPDGNILALVSG